MILRCILKFVHANRVTKPSITLLSRADGDKILIECQVNNYYPDKLTVQWLRNEQPISTSLPNKKLQNGDGKEKTFTLISQLAISVRDRGTLYTCKATHNSEEITQSYNVCTDLAKPLIHLKKPHLRDIMKGGEVTTTCVVEAPHYTEVSWLVNSASKQATRQSKTDLSSSRTQIVSNLTLTKEDWLSLRTLVCKGKHPCVQEEKAAIEAENILKNPVVVIRRPFRESESAVLECVVRDLPSSEVCITLQANDADISEINCVDVTQSENIQSLTTDFTIPKEHHKKDKTFTCTVRSLSKSWTSKPTGNIFDDPTVELSVVPSVSGSSSNPEKLVCSGTGFDPKITWLPNYEAKTGPVVTIGEDGRVKVYSEILVTQQEWNQGIKFTCKITDQLFSKTVYKNINICSAQTFSEPLILVKKPHLRDIMKGGEVTTTCVVEAPHNTEVSWLVNGASKQATRQSKTDLSSSRTQIVSNLTLTKEDWLSLRTLVCKGKHPCVQEEKAAIEAENILKNPVVVIRRPFRESESAVLECVVRDLPSSEVCITLQANDADISEINCVDVTQSENIQSLTTDFTIPKEHHKKDKTFTCTVRSLSKSWTSKPTGNIFDDPTVELSVVPSVSGSSSNPEKLVCSGTGFDPKITWLPNYEAKTGPVVTIGEDGRVKVYSEILVTQQEWNQGIKFTCKITDQLFSKTVYKNINICSAQTFSEPLILVKKPHLRDIMKGGEVTTTCVVEAPHNTEVSWLVNGASKQATRQSKTDLSSSRTQIVSNLTLTKEDWLSLRTLVCKGKHPCVQEEKAAVEAENILKNPVVVIRRPFRESESAVLECVVRDLPSSEVCITLQANDADISEINCVDVTQSENIQSLTTDFTIPKEHHKKDKTFTCTVRSLSKSWTSKPTGNIFDDPTVELSVVPSASGSSSNPEKLVCSGTGFNPKITWLTKFEEKTGPVVTIGENGRVKVYSEILVSQHEWNQGVTFTCKITDQLIAKTIHKNISICAVNERSSQLADVYLLGPSLSDVRSGTDVILTCLVIGHRVKDFTVQWKTDGRNSNSHHYIQHPQDHANGTQSVQSILKVPVSTWQAYSVFTCEIKPFCSGDTQKKHISKTRDPKRPTVRIFKPSDSDLSGSQNTSLLCMITGFFPSEISVHWQLNEVQLDASRYTNSPVVSHIGAEGYSIYSALILPASQWKEEIYSCIVSHESSQNPIIATLENLYASLTHSAPTARLLQGSNELVCLAFGFSPSAIDITWLLGLTELSHQRVTSPAEGPDGKFSIRSHLHLLPTEWAPGEVYSCRVTHITGILLLNISKPEIFEEAIFMNENKAESIAHESLEEAWKMACSFLVLFLLSLFYGCTVTLVKVKTT